MQHEEILEQMMDQPAGRRKYHPGLRSPFANLQNRRYFQTQAALHKVHPPGHHPLGRYNTPRGRPPNGRGVHSGWVPGAPSPSPHSSALHHPSRNVYDVQQGHRRIGQRSSPAAHFPHSAPVRLQVGSSASNSTVDIAALGQPPPYSGHESLSRNTSEQSSFMPPNQRKRVGQFSTMFDSLEQNWSNTMSSSSANNRPSNRGGEPSPVASAADMCQAGNSSSEREDGPTQERRPSISRYSSQPEGNMVVHLPPAQSPHGSRSSKHHGGSRTPSASANSQSGDFQSSQSNGNTQRLTSVGMSPEVARAAGIGSIAMVPTPSMGNVSVDGGGAAVRDASMESIRSTKSGSDTDGGVSLTLLDRVLRSVRDHS